MLDTLHALYIASIRSEATFADWAYDAIRRYVVSDRACADWCKALRRANPDKLIAYVANADDTSTDGMTKACTSYLKRHCKLHL